MQSSHLTCAQHALLAPPVQAGVRQHARRRSNTPRRAALALGYVNDQVRQLLCLQALERPILVNNRIQDVQLPLVDGLARPSGVGHVLDKNDLTTLAVAFP